MPFSRYQRRAPGLERERFLWRPLPEVVGPRGVGRLDVGRDRAALLHARLFGSIASRQARRLDTPIVWAFAEFGLEAASRAESRTIFIECGSAHARARERILARAAAEYGIHRPSPNTRLLDRKLAEYEAATRIVVPAGFAHATFIAEGVDPAKLVPVRYGINTSSFAPAEGSLPSREFQILTVGNLGLEKGTFHLLRALRELPGPWRLTLVGRIARELSSSTDFRALSDRLNVIGPLQQDGLRDYYRQTNLFVLPSLQEGMSMAVLEALACGAPVVVTESSGYSKEELAGAGTVVPAGDVNSLRVAIEASMFENAESRRARRIGARRLAEAFTWASYGETVEREVRAALWVSD